MRKGGKLEGWKVEKLGDVSRINYGYTEKASFKEVGPKFLRITDIQDNNVDWETVPFCKIEKSESPKYLLKDGDIVFARTGATTGKSFLIKNPPLAVFASYLIRLQILDTSKLLPEYLILFFQTQIYWDNIAIGISGSAQGGFNASKLAELEIPIPPLPEQQRIVSVLDEAFASIAQAKSNAEQNLVNARELFESVLESFFEDPQHTPDGKELESLCELIVDCEHKTAPIQDEGYPSIRTPNIGRGYLILEGVNRVSEETYTRWTRRAIPQRGDLILAREAPAGNVAVIPDDLEVCLGQRTVLIRPNNKIFNSQYLMWLLLSGNVQKFFLQNSKGSTVVHVNMKDIRGLKINNIPPLAEQHKIVGRLEALSAETGRLEEIYQQKVESLDELKKSVLQKAFAGELQLSDGQDS
jgi:type I restriction enzyme S subunit